MNAERVGAASAGTLVTLQWVLGIATGVSMAVGAWEKWSDWNVVVRFLIAAVAFSFGTSLFAWVSSMLAGAFIGMVEGVRADDNLPLGKGILAWALAAMLWILGLLFLTLGVLASVDQDRSMVLTTIDSVQAIAFVAPFGFASLLCSAAIAGRTRATLWIALLSCVVVAAFLGALGDVLQPDGAFRQLPGALAKRALFSGVVFGLLGAFAAWRYRRERTVVLRPAIDGLRAKRELRGELTSSDAQLLERLTAEYLKQFPAAPPELR